MRILITNDDGIHAPALRVLQEELRSLGEVVIVAPDRDQSAASHALTLQRPLRVQRLSDHIYSVDGTPTDCVVIASNGLLSEKPELVVSGINHGPNMGEDVTYSGTVAAATEGVMQKVPALAVSLVTREPADFRDPARFVRELVQHVTGRGMGRSTLLNVNIPHRPWAQIQGVRLTRLGTRIYRDTLIEKTDPRGRAYYWIGGLDPVWEVEDGTDFQAVQEGYISVTPLSLDLTDYKTLVEMKAWGLHP
jgi:5'-nucleotidase